MKRTGATWNPDYSEEHMRFWMSYKNPTYNLSNNPEGIGRNPDNGGDFEYAASYYTNWTGPANEKDAPYVATTGEAWPASKMKASAQRHVTGTEFVGNDINKMKAAIYAYGGVEVSIFAPDVYPGNPNYNSVNFDIKNYALYNDVARETNHAVFICGWNDNYPRTNFLAGK